jgi:hypothetical protein
MDRGRNNCLAFFRPVVWTSLPIFLFRTLFSISVFEPSRSKVTPLPVKFSADEMKPQEAHKDVGSRPITRYAVRLDPVNRITFYSGIVRGLAPIQARR